MEPSDAALVEQVLAGRKDAFAHLVRRHQDAVYGLALRWTGDRDEAQDLAQETFVRAYRKLRSYDPGYSMRNWLLAICANLAKNQRRSAERRERAHREHADRYLGPPDPPDPRSEALEEALLRLPEKLRIPLVLKHVEGMSYEEVARTLRIGLSAAKMRVKRARDELVRRIRAASGGDEP